MRKKLIKLSLILFTIQLLFTGLFAQDEQKAELIVETGHTLAVNSIAFSPDGNILASGSSDNTIKLWDLSSGLELKNLSLPTRALSSIMSIAFSFDGNKIASGNWNHTIVQSK